jgi:hypothetical protein
MRLILRKVSEEDLHERTMYFGNRVGGIERWLHDEVQYGNANSYSAKWSGYAAGFSVRLNHGASYLYT